MTREDAIYYLQSSGFSEEQITTIEKALKQEPKWERLYSWLNDMWFGIAPDESVTDIDERRERQAQVDVINDIMEWMLKQEPQESEE